MLDHFNHLSHLIQEASTNGVLNESDILTGFSGKKLIGSLQRFANYLVNDQQCYLEVGVFQGLSLLSVALSIPDGFAYGIDNFAYFDKDRKNFSIVKERTAKLKLSNVGIINMDYEDALENLNDHLNGKKVGVYFIDGPHDYRSQLMCLSLIKPFLSPDAVILVDDCNYNQVRQANRDFLLTNPEFKLLYQTYTQAHPMNQDQHGKQEAAEGWWNGVNVIVKDPENILVPLFPPCMRDKTIFENEQLIQTSKYPLAFERNISLVTKIEEIKRKIKKKKIITDRLVGKYDRMNTYSEHLTRGEFNQSVMIKSRAAALA